MLDVSIVIVSYNTKNMTIACLRSIYEQTQDFSFEVIVVDNSSSDGSAAAIASEFPDVSLTCSTQNIGFARANNLATKYCNAKYILLLNPDTVVLDGAIKKIYDFAVDNPLNRIYGGRTMDGNGVLDPTSCWKKPTLWSLFCYASCLTAVFPRNRLFDPESYGHWKRDSVRNVDIVTGCFLLIETSLWKKLKGFSPDFFMYAEEADLCLRAKREYGADPLFSPDPTIIHYGGASHQVSDDKMVRMLKAKNQLLHSQWNPKIVKVGSAMYLVGVMVRTILYRILAMGSKAFCEKANCWLSVWERRDEWMNGK